MPKPMEDEMKKIDERTNWILQNADALRKAMTPLSGSSHNARYNDGMSNGGWGNWVKAFRAADLEEIAQPMNYWSGSNPTPSTAINAGVANYIRTHAPAHLDKNTEVRK